jgi:hypothetical protein
MTWCASSGDKLWQVLSNVSITLITSLTAGRNLSYTDRQTLSMFKTDLAFAVFACTESVPHLICSSFYNNHVVFALRKKLWSCQASSLKSMGHQNLYRYIKVCGNRYIDISVFGETFRLCVAVRKGLVAPAGNKFSCLFHQKTANATHNVKLRRHK